MSSKKIALLGPKGTYSHAAVHKYDSVLEPVFFPTITAVIESVRKGEYQKAVLPFENSIQGTVVEMIDGLYEHKLQIADEVVLDIAHCIAGIEEIDTKNIDAIYSHPQALGQCKNYIQNRFPQAKVIPTASTAAAFEKIKSENVKTALAIGSEFGAEGAGLTILDTNIQDLKDNQTVFVVIDPEIEKSPLKHSWFVLHPREDRVGLLYDILGLFKERNINLNNIVSRPAKEGLGVYLFYVSIDISSTEVRQSDIMRALEKLGVVVTLITK